MRLMHEPSGDVELFAGRGRRLEFYLDFCGHGRDAEAVRQLGHGLVEECGEDATVNDPLISLVSFFRNELRADGSGLRVDLEFNGETDGVFPAAYEAALVVAELSYHDKSFLMNTDRHGSKPRTSLAAKKVQDTRSK